MMSLRISLKRPAEGANKAAVLTILREPLQCIQNKLTEALRTSQSTIPKGPIGIMGWIEGRGTTGSTASPHETQILLL